MTKIASRPAGTGFVAPNLTDREKAVIVGGVLMSMLLAALDQSIVAPAMPTIAAALGHEQYLPWIVTGYLLTATAVAPLYGKISDIYGRRLTLYAALVIFLTGSVLSAIAPNMFVLIIGRAVQGIGGGGLFALTQIVIGDLVPPRERARYAVWISGTWAVASIAGPLLGGTLADHLHWSLIFWINIPLGLAAMFVINAPLKKLPLTARHHRLDALGALFMIAATTLLLLTLNWGGTLYPWLSGEIFWLACGSLLLWIVFAVRLTRATEPLVSLEVLANPIVLAGCFAMFLVQAGNVGLTVYLPLYLQSYLHLSASDSGFALLGLLLGTVVGSAVSGHLAGRLTHYKRLALFGAALATLGLCVFGFVVQQAPLAIVEVLTIIIGIGMGVMFPVLTVSVQNAVDHAHLGVATGVLTFLRSLGSALGVAVLGAIALGYGVPIVGEGTDRAVVVTSSEPFAAIFFTTGAMMLATLLIIAWMPQKPLRGYASESVIPA